MPATKITASSNNVLYLDFDGTLTGAEGQDAFEIIKCYECKNCKTSDSREKFMKDKFAPELEGSNDKFKIVPEAKTFLNTMNKLHPHVQIVIISRNYENYIRALLEFENIETTNIMICARDTKLNGQGKEIAVSTLEQNFQPGLRFICDDDRSDCLAMQKGCDPEDNLVISHWANPGEFKWAKYFDEIFTKIRHVLPVAEYLHGRVTTRFHLFSVTTESLPEGKTKLSEFNGLKGDDLKRAILNQLKSNISNMKTLERLSFHKTEFLNSSSYKLLMKGQGVTTKLFSLQTDSQRAVESIFSNREAEIKENKNVTPKN